MMLSKTDQETIVFLEDSAAKEQARLPDGFLQFLRYSEEEIIRGNWPHAWSERSGIERQRAGTAFALALLDELRILFCTADEKYNDVRQSGKDFAKLATTAVAGFLAGRFGIEVAVVSSAVAAGFLLIVRVGLESFCRSTSGLK